MSSAFDASCLPEYLKVYYKNLFPFSSVCKWLSYSKDGSGSLNHREVALILKDDVYLRYKSYDDAEAFAQDVQTLCPYKIDIGAVFNAKPRDHKIVKGLEAVCRELVFDIDLTDYDDVRTCCQGGEMCCKCWKFITIAMAIVDAALNEDFDFHHRLWVYSGRRGVHCWVSDTSARQLSNQERATLADYLTLIVGGEKQTKKITAPLEEEVIHPLISRSLQLIPTKIFTQLIEEQDWFGSGKLKQIILDNKPDEKNRIEKIIQSNGDEASKWKEIEKTLPRRLVSGVKLELTYPRLDANVTKGINHLLKSPFCVHPKTGKIAVPIQVSKMSVFNPEQVPTISGLVEEVVALQNSTKGPIDYKRTSLADAISLFDQFIANLSAEHHVQKENDPMQF